MKKPPRGAAFSVLYAFLLEQAQHRAAVLVRLREHRLGCLEQDVVLRVSGHFRGHVGVLDRGHRGLGILAYLQFHSIILHKRS